MASACVTRSQVAPEVPRVLINNEAVGKDTYACAAPLTFARSLAYDTQGNTRDVFMCGTTDEMTAELADEIGWKAELDALVAEVEARRRAGSTDAAAGERADK